MDSKCGILLHWETFFTVLMAVNALNLESLKVLNGAMAVVTLN